MLLILLDRSEYRLRLGQTPMLLTCLTSRSWSGRVTPPPQPFDQNQYSGFTLSCSLRFSFIPRRLFLTVDYQPVTVASRTAVLRGVSIHMPSALWCSPLHKSAANPCCISRPRPPGLTVRDCQRYGFQRAGHVTDILKCCGSRMFVVSYFRLRPPVLTCWGKCSEP